MGRPLNKKYFGNTNYTALVGFGGESIASFGTILPGTGWTVAPAITVAAPTDPVYTGATATVAPHFKAATLAVTANGTLYEYDDDVTLTTGTFGTAATSTVAAIKAVSLFSISNVGTDGWKAGDTFTISNAGGVDTVITVDTITVVATLGEGTIATAHISTAGHRLSTSTTAYSTTTGTGTGTPAFVIHWGVYSLSTPTIPGDYTVFPSIAGATSSTTGTGCTVTATMELLSVAVLTSGSGYTTLPALIFTGGTPAGAEGAGATATFVSNRNTAIIIRAYLPVINTFGYISGAGGSSVLASDIVKQEAAYRYKVQNAQGVGIVKLKSASVAVAPGEANIIATDINNGTYYVDQLTSRKAVLFQFGAGPWEFPSDTNVHWTLGTAETLYSVTIENA